MKNVIIYHSGDFDGIMSGEIAHYFLDTPENPVEMIGWDFGQDYPTVPDDCRLYILDLNIATLMAHPNLIWIDHHISAINAFPETIKGYRIDGVAACRLTYAWFFYGEGKNPLPTKTDYGVIENGVRTIRNVSEPHAIRMLGQWDIWDHEDPNVREFQFGMRAIQPNRKTFKALIKGDENAINHIHQIGDHILQYQKSEDEKLMGRSFDVQFSGLTFLAINGRAGGMSFESALKPRHDACMSFFWNGKCWVVSLYHAPGRERFELNKIAEKFEFNGKRGGGHKGACGFSCAELPFDI